MGVRRARTVRIIVVGGIVRQLLKLLLLQIVQVLLLLLLLLVMLRVWRDVEGSSGGG